MLDIKLTSPEAIRLIQKWIDALNSGEYAQTLGEYKSDDPNCFCATGLLFEISGAGKWERIDGTYLLKINERLYQSVLGAVLNISDFLNISGEDQSNLSTLARAVISLNELEHTFKEIAEYLETTI